MIVIIKCHSNIFCLHVLKHENVMLLFYLLYIYLFCRCHLWLWETFSAGNMINEFIVKHQSIHPLLFIAVRNYKQQAFKKYTSHLFVLIPRVLTELSLSSVWALQVRTCFLLPYIQQSTNCITKRCFTTTKNREFDIADTQQCVFFFSKGNTMYKKASLGNSKILGSIKNFFFFSMCE